MRRFPFFVFLLLLAIPGRLFASTEDYQYSDYQSQQGGASSNTDYRNSSYDVTGMDSSDYSDKSMWPNMTVFEMLGPMKHDGGSGHVNMTNWMTAFDFVRLKKGSWGFHADGAFRMTWLDGDQDANFELDRLFTVWVNMTVSYRLWGSTVLSGGVTPQWSSDFDSWVSDNFFFGAHVTLSGKLSESFSYTVGGAYAPQIGNTPWLPFFGFSWKLNPKWRLDLQATKLILMNKVSEGFSWGPFCAVTAGTWTVRHNKRHERFEWISGVAGVSTETGLGHWGRVRPKLLGDVGFSVWNRARFKSSNGDDEYASYRFKPGFYMRVGVQLSF
ncbi:MAG: DUF6268 family outer membrane beta-barrel protein [Akkermansia sp.]